MSGLLLEVLIRLTERLRQSSSKHVAQCSTRRHSHTSSHVLNSPSAAPPKPCLPPKCDPTLSVRLLVPRAGTRTTELLGLAPAVVGDEESAVVCDEGLLQLVLAVLVDVLLVVGDL